VLDFRSLWRVKERLLYLTHSQSGGKISVVAQPDGEKAIAFSVTDTGHGIPRIAFRQIFDRVDRVKTNWIEGKSTGLGLPFSKMAVEAHGGSTSQLPSPSVSTTTKYGSPQFRQRDNSHTVEKYQMSQLTKQR
jgi:two-component system, OmpR family, sensor histidine kinase VicK